MRSRRSLAASAAAAALALCALGSAPAAVAFTAAPPPSSSRRAAAGGAAAGRRRVGRGGVVRLSSTKSGGGSGNKAAIDADESSEYEYDESEFADYSSDYSDLPDALSSSSDEDEDDDEIEGSLLDAYDDYDAIGGYDLSPFERHAREVFLTYAERVESKLDHEADDLAARENEECESTQLANAAILKKDLYEMLGSLDIEASRDEAESLFKFLDVNGDGSVSLEEFMPWYAEAVDAAQGVSAAFQDLVKSRSTVHRFDATEVDDGVLRRALECAVAAPNRQGNDPWRFIKLGKETVGKVVELREKMHDRGAEGGGGGGGGVDGSFVSWTKVPHWIVVTYAKAPPGSGPDGMTQQRENFKSTCCAVQNFLLSMWSEGIGTKWTDGPIQRTTEFAEICGIDLEKEKVAGVIWYGFARGGLNKVERESTRRGVEEVLDVLP